MKARPDPASKPYYKCFSCAQFRNTCGGIPTRGMDLKEWCEYMRDVKDIAHLTNAHISQKSDVSIKTIERIMAINIDQDIMRATARRIELAVVGAVGNYDCSLSSGGDAASERISRLIAEAEYWRKEDERKAKIIDKLLEK